MNCKDLELDFSLYLYDELTPDERTACEAHLSVCSRCREALEENRRVHQLLSQRPTFKPSPVLLAECRQALDEALDREPPRTRWQELFGFSVFSPGTAFRTVGALGVLVFGFSLGWTLRTRDVVFHTGSPGAAPASISGTDLDNMRVKDITSVAPDPKTGDVHITLDASRRVTVEGSLDDLRIQQVLVSAMKSYDNPGIRRDTLDALRARGNNPNIRQALLYAMAHDSNLGVRLEALDAVRGLDWSSDSRQAFLNVLEHDTNPGIRAAALDELVRHSDRDMLPIFARLAANDSCRYVRMKSANAMQELSGSGK